MTLGLLILLSLVVAFFTWRWRQEHLQSQVRAIAVLPLENLSGDPAQEFFADGITDELITEIASLLPLKVISRTSVMQYKGLRRPLPEIGRELNVDAILEGSILRSGQQVRVTAQLIDTHSDTHLWSAEYTREVQDVISLQREVTSDIAHQIRLQLLLSSEPI
jgi:TolB-like protein